MLSRLVLGLALLALAAGCGGSGKSDGGSSSPEDVVRAWSEAINANDNETAASLFASGSVAIQSGLAIVLDTRDEAVRWNAGLPCSGTITEISASGSVVTATFLLGERPEHRCNGPGAQAAAAFRIEDGKIVVWEQIGSAPPPGVS